MKILQIVDSPSWAIGHLAAIPRRHLPHLRFKVLYVHPRHVSEHLDEVSEALPWADIVDLQYWNTAAQLLDMLPELAKKKLILTHHNQKDLLTREWTEISWHIVHTKKAEAILRGAGYANVKIIPYGFDLSYFEYINEPIKDNKVVGYVGRIVPWKGIKEIAQACFELKYQLAIMGKMEKPSYWNEIPMEHRSNMNLSFMDVPDDDRYEFYKNIAIYVGNSGDNHEEGTMPLQEVMACGVPAVTTPSGVAADICVDHDNALVIPFGDYEALKVNIKQLIEDDELREKLRRAAWQTIKGHTEERMAREFEKLYHLVYDEEPLVSIVVVATPDRIDNVKLILESLADSGYPHLEAVVCFDQCENITPDLKSLDSGQYDFPIKLLCTGRLGGYNLAMARNLAVIEAVGELLLFCDSRILPESGSISVFVAEYKNRHKDKIWWYGDKNTGKRTFVENFSAIKRDYLIKAGMFNERIDCYGGMSQELRARFESQGFEAKFLPEAKASQITSSHLTLTRRRDIIKSKLKLWKLGLT